MWRRGVAGTALLVALTGCAGQPGPPTYACFEVPVERAAVEGARPAADLPADRLAQVRRPWVDDPAGWFVAVDSSERFMLLRPDPDKPSEYDQAQFEWEDGRWYAAAARCDLQRQVAGHVASTVHLAPGEAPGPAARAVTLQVMARECRSGARTDPTVLDVQEDAAAVRILVKARALPDPEREQTRTCLPNLPTEVTVPLDRPLGGRFVLDVGVFPPRVLG